jgi:O-antigen ligase
MNLRLPAICFSAASIGLSIVLVSVAKLLLFITALFVLIGSFRRERADGQSERRKTPYVVWTVLLVLAVMASSLLWTTAPLDDALGSLAKYGKLLVIPLFWVVVRTRREALFGLAVFFAAQLFLVVSSWLLVARIPIPWATSNMAVQEYAVFSSYLDQGIMGALFAALCWQFRRYFPGRFGPWIAVSVSIMTLCNVLFVLSGRSGHVVALALISMSIMWELPRRYRLGAIFVPFLLIGILMVTPGKLRDRMNLVSTEVQSYRADQPTVSSSGVRLGLWTSSLRLVAKHPALGTGIGSWSTEYNLLQRQQNPKHVDVVGNWNPHQEYLLWGVQLGMAGPFLFLGLFAAALADTRSMNLHEARALQLAVAALAVASLFNSSLYDAFIGDFFCITIALLLAVGSQFEPRIRPAEPASVIST